MLAEEGVRYIICIIQILESISKEQECRNNITRVIVSNKEYKASKSKRESTFRISKYC